MKVHVSSYTFNAATRKITFPDYTTITLDQILLITNVTAGGIIIYNFADTSLTATISGNVVTLSYDTTSMSNTDKLLIYFDDADKTATDASLVVLQQLVQAQSATIELLKKLVKLNEPNQVTDNLLRQRVIVDGMNGAATMSASYAGNNTSPTAVSANLYSFLVSESPVDQRWRIADGSRSTFASAIKSNLTWY